MMQASLKKNAHQGLVLSGELSFETVPALADQIIPWLAKATALQISLAQVSRADSAGVALLVEWLRQARVRDIALQYLDIPEQMLSIVRVSGLDSILPLVRST